MTKNSLWKVVPAVLTLVLVACQDSITGIPDPVVAAAPDVAVEAVSPVAMMTSGPCLRPGVELISWWTGDGDFLDFQGANPIVSSAGVSFVTGVDGQAFSFGGSNTQIEIADSGTLRPGVFTVDLWAERTGAGQNRDNSYGNILIEKALDDMSLAAPLWSYFIGWRDNGRIAAAVYFDNDPGSVTVPQRIVSTDAFPDDAPIFIALTVDGPANAHMVTLYVNGDVQGTFDATGLGSVVYGAPGNGSTVIGANYRAARNVNFPRTFQGVIDEVEIFDRALTQAELQTIQTAGKCKTPNAAPVIDPFADGSIDEGSVFETSVTFTDHDSGTWTAVVDYGDGTVDNDAAVTGTSVALSHVYAQDGTYPVTVTVTDDLLEAGSSSASVVVNNVAPVVDAGPDATILEGDTFESAGSFTDPGADAWTATVDYGDGSGMQPLALSGKTFELSHTYAVGGSFTVTVTVDDGSSVSLAEMVLSVDEVDVTVVFPLTIDQATVKLAKGRSWFRRRGKDSYQVDGRIPVEFLELFDPETEDLTIAFAGVLHIIPAGSFVRRGGRSHKLRFKAGRRQRSGIQRFDLHDDGRFKVQVRGPFEPDLRYANLGEPVDFSLVLGTDIGEASIQLDRRLHFRAHRGRDHDRGDDDDDDGDGDDGDDDGDDDKHGNDRLKKALKRFWGRRGR